MPNPEAVLDFRMPPQPQFCRAARHRVADFARSRGVEERDIAELLTALGEALVNAVEHGRSSEPIAINCRIEGAYITAIVEDRGVGFDSAISAGSLIPGPFCERGRGLAIMRRCTDELAVSSLPGKGTSVTLRRLLAACGRVRGWGVPNSSDALGRRGSSKLSMV